MTFAEAFQDWLDETGSYSFTRDYAAWRARYLLPFTLSTRTGTTTVRGEEELKRLFFGWVEMLEGQGVTDAKRIAHGVTPVGPDRLMGRYTTQLYRGDEAVGAPYEGSGTLRHVDGAWRVEEMWIEVENRSFPLTPPRTEQITDDTDIGDVLSDIAKEAKR